MLGEGGVFQRRLLLAVFECGFGAGGPRLKLQGAAAAGPRRAEAKARTAGCSRTEERRGKNRKAQSQRNRGVPRQKPQGAVAAGPRRAKSPISPLPILQQIFYLKPCESKFQVFCCMLFPMISLGLDYVIVFLIFSFFVSPTFQD